MIPSWQGHHFVRSFSLDDKLTLGTIKKRAVLMLLTVSQGPIIISGIVILLPDLEYIPVYVKFFFTPIKRLALEVGAVKLRSKRERNQIALRIDLN